MTKDEAWEMIDSALEHCYSEKDVLTLKEALAQREWVGLTDEERAECWRSSAKQSAINIEAKLKELNT